MNHRYAIVEAPSVLGLRPTGVEVLPEALLAAGLADRLAARRAGRVQPPPYDDRRDPETLMLNPHSISEYTPRLANAVSDVLDVDGFPLVLGGDCSIVLGCLLALKRRGRHGLLFVDGHADYYQPEANINGEAASSELAFATGRGPTVLTRFEGHHPMARSEDVAVVGFRDADEAAGEGSQSLPAEIKAFDLDTVRRSGAEAVVNEAILCVAHVGLEGFWIHLDADVLDDAVMPAVDYRLPGGLSWDELVTVLRVALGTGKAVGMDVTIFNPKLDADGSITEALVGALVRGLRPQYQ